MAWIETLPITTGNVELTKTGYITKVGSKSLIRVWKACKLGSDISDPCSKSL